MNTQNLYYQFLTKISLVLLLIIFTHNNILAQKSIKQCLADYHLYHLKSILNYVHNKEILINKLDNHTKNDSNIVSLSVVSYGIQISHKEILGDTWFYYDYHNIQPIEKIPKTRYYKNLRKGGFSVGTDTLMYLEKREIDSFGIIKISAFPVYPRLNIISESIHDEEKSVYRYHILEKPTLDYSQPYIKYNLTILKNDGKELIIELLVEIPLNEKEFWCFSDS